MHAMSSFCMYQSDEDENGYEQAAAYESEGHDASDHEPGSNDSPSSPEDDKVTLQVTPPLT